MRLRKLHLRAFGPFTDRVLDFGAGAQNLVVVWGANEAGKSSALRAISALRFGIPMQSKDDFVHPHPSMRVGGEFVDRDGRLYSLVRRKGRSATLRVVDFANPGSALDAVAAPEIEALLNGGLTKEMYDSMFGIDHRSLREGGEALLQGDGEVGAALFEASAGVRSVPDLLERLDTAARQYFIPGARGRNAKINEALTTYDAHQTAFKQAQVRPGQWAELAKSQAQAAEALAALESRRQEIHRQLLLIQELRAVAPLLGALDAAAAVLAELDTAPLLAMDAAAHRAAAESGSADARNQARLAGEQVERESARLAALTLDPVILPMAAAVRRLAASAESIDRHRREIADAALDVESLSLAIAALAARIAPGVQASEVYAQSPVKTQRAEIERLLRASEQAQRALEHHRAAASRGAEAAAASTADLPSAAARTALRLAQGQVARGEVDLQRLVALPTEIKAARRAVAQSLAMAGLRDPEAFAQVRPLLDADIDAALNAQSQNATRRGAYETRVEEVTRGMHTAHRQRDRWLLDGAVPTRDDVAAVRGLRHAAWATLRDVYIERSKPLTEADIPLTATYEDLVAQADDMVDALASDTRRATELQACKDSLGALERDRADLKAKLAEVAADETEQARVWLAALEAARLPSMAPAALRDWQALLPAIRTALDTLQARLDEFERVTEVEGALSAQLRAAIDGTGRATLSGAESLSVLTAIAADIDQGVRDQESAQHHAAGAEVERQRQLRQWAARDTELVAAQDAAAEALRPALATLLLPATAGDAVARARLDEFEQLNDLHARLSAAETVKGRAESALASLRGMARVLWEGLGDAPPADLRLYCDQLLARLESAERVQAEHHLARQATDQARATQRDHEALELKHRESLSGLCHAAGVDSASELPEAEELSRRKRDAQQVVDRTRVQLAQASKRTALELRTLTAARDVAQMDADEESLTQEQNRGDLAAAREREELARRELNDIDSSDVAAASREAMERAAASVQASMAPWIRSKIAHSLLAEALRRFRERAQGPMLTAASTYFERMTRGRFVRLSSDDSGKEPVLIALRNTGERIGVAEMSEGTRDQLYLALRLAALDFRRAAGVDLPLILDDILMTSDEERSAAMLEALGDAAQSHQVIVFTHHRHIADIAAQSVPAQALHLVTLE